MGAVLWRLTKLASGVLLAVLLLATLLPVVSRGCRPSAWACSRDDTGRGTADAGRRGDRAGVGKRSSERGKRTARFKDAGKGKGPRAGLPGFKLSAWIPRWRKKEGTASALAHLSLFASLSPFAFRTGRDGEVRDTLKARAEPWPELQRRAREQDVHIIPTFVWAEPTAMARQLEHANWRQRHVRAIAHAVTENGFDGADIDYESKDSASRDAFSTFVVELSEELHRHGRVLSCTVEPRTSDQPPFGWRGVRTAAWANDYAVLGQACDEIRVMAYDQWRIAHGSRWRSRSPEPQVSHADLRWVEQVVQYTRQVVAPRKLLLGIPTYGWEFSIEGSPGNWLIERMQALSFPAFQAQQKRFGRPEMTARRHPSGELVMDFTHRGRRRLLRMPDAKAVEQRIRLAKRRGLGGVVLFKLDGLADPAVWEVLPAHVLHKGQKAIGWGGLQASGET